MTASQEDNSPPQVPDSLLTALDLLPSPQLVAGLLKSAERPEVAASLLTSLLDAYIHARAKEKSSSSAWQSILFIQHILQLCDVFGAGVLQDQPNKVLAFVAFALGDGTSRHLTSIEGNHSANVQDEDGAIHLRSKSGKTDDLPSLFDIKGTHSDADEDFNELESDEEEEELKETALNLLLALLEGDSAMTPETHTLLKVIQPRVEAAALSAQESIRASAREALLVLTARSQSVKNQVHHGEHTETLNTPEGLAYAKGREMYQDALKLLQDPIMPVRAHGLISLKDLAGYGTTFANLERRNKQQDILMDPALIPAILDIFIQAVCDDESFLYLNAVKGLAEIGNAGGRMMIKRLVALYVDQAPRSTKSAKASQAEVDKRLRVGEALLQVVQRLEEALAAYSE